MVTAATDELEQLAARFGMQTIDLERVEVDTDLLNRFPAPELFTALLYFQRRR